MMNRKVEYWLIPPQADSEYVAHMDVILDTHERPYDPAIPVVDMDEKPVQLLKETRPPIPATKTQTKHVDYEHERGGTASIFLSTEPLAGCLNVLASFPIRIAVGTED